jgi:superfamily II DNA or RNA helicase
MNNLSELSIKTDYRSGRDIAWRDFYDPCMSNSISFSRAVGYFRSSIYVIIGKALLEFIKNKGKIRLICSPSLTQSDVDAISNNIFDDDRLKLRTLEQEVQNILDNKEENKEAKILATLLRFGVLEIKIALILNGNGIYHEKLGIFSDDKNNSVSFIGSANETYNAWHENGNFESIEVFCSWKELRESERTKRHLEEFNKLWRDESAGVKVIDFPSALKQRLIKIAEDDIEGIKDLIKGQKDIFEKIKINDLMPHQIEAIEKWKLNGCKGILQHATGSGKTVTAISAINEHTKNGYAALVLVPSKLLLDQWIKECTREMPNIIWIAAGSGHNSWKKNKKLNNFINDDKVEYQRLIISTMQTASTSEFIKAIEGNKNILIVADEVHQLGSESNSRFLSVDTNFRMGLSATPQRYGDPDGTRLLMEYFGGIIQPHISLYDAIKSGRLVEYEYMPKVISLTPVETELWREKTKQIKKEIARTNNGKDKLHISDKAHLMLIQRARISKKSATKSQIALEIIDENFKKGQSWLIYCEDQEQLKEVNEKLEKNGHNTLKYYSDMDGSSEETLKYFRSQGGILVSIRCLDEGVDIPSISHAIILASSQNPRQFIQRRGRVLRKHSSKIYAKIYDTIVLPESLEEEPDQLALVKSELVRAYEFSSNAINVSSGETLKIAAMKLGIDINEFIDNGIEDKEGNENE